jgi:glycosyltransferase involved in cell wall biosynthesis
VVHAARAKRLPAVLVVAESGIAGGVSRYCVDVAAELGPLAEIACLCPQPCEGAGCWLSARCLERAVTLHRVAVPPRAWRRGVRGLHGLWHSLGRPVVHVNGRRGNALAIALRLAAPGFRYVTTVHGILGLHDRRNVVYRIVDLSAGWLARSVIAVSADGHRALLRAGSPRSRTTTISNGLAAGDLAALGAVARMRVPRGSAGVRFGFLGRLSPEKGTHDLAAIARTIAGDGPPATLDIAGEGVDAAWLAAQVAVLAHPERIRLRGLVTDIVAFLGQVDVLVMPSRNEGLPYALLEAMAAGCAILAYDVGGIPEALDEPSVGVTVPAGDLASLLAAVDRLRADPSAVAVLGTAGAERVAERFALSGRRAKLLAAYGLADCADHQ